MTQQQKEVLAIILSDVQAANRKQVEDFHVVEVGGGVVSIAWVKFVERAA